jgi:basic membrane protein A
MRSRLSKGLIMLVVFALTGAACGDDGSTTGSSAPATDGGTCRSDITVAVALDVGGLGDNGFNDLAKKGLDDAIADGTICEENTEFIEANATGTNLDENVQSVAEAGYDLIIGTGFAFTGDGKVNELAPEYPDTMFGIIDGYATACGEKPEDCGLVNPASAIPNVVDLTFSEQEGSFLVGVAAAMKAQELDCDNIGFLGGQTGFLIGKFEAGYRSGVAAIDPKMTVQVEYIGDTTLAFDDIPGGEALSNKMYDNGACIIYHAAGDAGNGLFKAAAAQEKLAVGVDSDQYLVVSSDQAQYILTSMIKRVDTATYDTIVAVADGTFEGGITEVFDLASEGISYSTSNTELMTQDIIDEVEGYKQQILDGDIVPPIDPLKV